MNFVVGFVTHLIPDCIRAAPKTFFSYIRKNAICIIVGSEVVIFYSLYRFDCFGCWIFFYISWDWIEFLEAFISFSTEWNRKNSRRNQLHFTFKENPPRIINYEYISLYIYRIEIWKDKK